MSPLKHTLKAENQSLFVVCLSMEQKLEKGLDKQILVLKEIHNIF